MGLRLHERQPSAHVGGDVRVETLVRVRVRVGVS